MDLMRNVKRKRIELKLLPVIDIRQQRYVTRKNTPLQRKKIKTKQKPREFYNNPDTDDGCSYPIPTGN